MMAISSSAVLPERSIVSAPSASAAVMLSAMMSARNRAANFFIGNSPPFYILTSSIIRQRARFVNTICALIGRALFSRDGRRAFPRSMSAVSTPIRSPATGAAVWIRWFILLHAHRSARVSLVDERGEYANPLPPHRSQRVRIRWFTRFTRIGRRAFPWSMSMASTPICSPTSLAASADSQVRPLCTRIGRRAFP